MDIFFRENYQMVMAGKIRTFSQVQLVPSKFNPENPVFPHKEFERVSLELCNTLCTQKEELTLEEIEFLQATLKVPYQEVKSILQTKPYWEVEGKKQDFQILFKKYLG